MRAIDVHAHYLPADYRQALLDNGHAAPDGWPLVPAWDADSHLAMMDSLGIETSMLSVSSPGVAFGADPATWARSVNETGAAVVRAHPKRFGLFASLPLPDVEAARREITYAFDTLHADGVVLLTNFRDVYLGDERFEPVMAELDRRKARIFIHPTSPACFAATSLGNPRPMLEFLFDTTRAVTNLVLSGTIERFPGLEIIVPHAGAALPVLADRIAGMAKILPLGGQTAGAIDVLGGLRRLHYEVGAGFPFPLHVKALLELVGSSKLLFGTDFPFGTVGGVRANLEALLATDMLNSDERARLLDGHARELFLRL